MRMTFAQMTFIPDLQTSFYRMGVTSARFPTYRGWTRYQTAKPAAFSAAAVVRLNVRISHVAERDSCPCDLSSLSLGSGFD